jgi:protein-disulfide isomerase
MTSFATCFDRTDIRQPIVDATNAALAAGISSTPTLRINGQVYPGVPTYDQLHAVILQLAAQASPTTLPSATPSPS